MNPLAAKILNVALYQAGWFCCVLGAAWGLPVSGALGAALLAGVHLLLARSRGAEALRMLVFCLIGVTVDGAQQALGLFAFRADPAWPFSLPLWVFVIWAQFATLFRYALLWLSGRYLLAGLFGLVGGPLAYGGGIRLGAAAFGGDPLLGLLALGAVWALLTPALLRISDRIGGGEGGYRWFGGR
ncbi:MAG: DUF2878 domain-containing protein [Desulfuromonas sp.]|uniref:DUF2878 domain-containing protein n=1 Tax=Desulfuromonas sp. TaxID=892 RepID=UPI000CC205AD|nr:DUF2878 domain-containing protein [Desulfuromonas sp.]PLX83284.1 MAG: DUF2878 domain-containing protein [Desulfuromonas sp.]